MSYDHENHSFYLGQSGWGIAWYLNNEIIPVLTLTRGVTYTFEVYGGDNPVQSAQYHPFYITDDPNGGYVQQPVEVREVGLCKRLIYGSELKQLYILVHAKLNADCTCLR